MSFYSFVRGWSFCVVWDGQTGGGSRQIAILSHNFFFWPQHAVLSSRPHLALLLQLGQGCSTGGLVWATGSSGRALGDCKLALTVSNSLNWRPPIWRQQPSAQCSHRLQLALTLAFSTSNSLNWRPPYWRQQPQAGCPHWLQIGSYSGLHCPNWLNYRRHLHILFHNTYLLPIRSHDLPLIYTGASLTDGLVKGLDVIVLQLLWFGCFDLMRSHQQCIP